MKNTRLAKILKEIPLRTRLKVSCEMAFINLITELGYREDKMWTEDEDDILGKLVDLANELSYEHLESIKQWEKDGKPE